MGDVAFARRFLLELAEWEGSASPRDVEALDRVLAAIGTDPNRPGRVPSFYDPANPSYLYRTGNVLVHYRVRGDDTVEFLNLFFRRV